MMHAHDEGTDPHVIRFGEIYFSYGWPGVIKAWHIANCATEPHDTDEIVRIDPFTSEIPYEWALKNG